MEKTNSFNEEEMQVCRQLGVNDINELDDELRSYVRALTHVKEVAEKGAEEDFVTKEQLEIDLREALTEAFHAKREGRKLKTLELKELSLRFAPLGVKPIPFSVYDKPTIGLTT